MTKDRAKAKALKYLEWAEKNENKSKQVYDSFNNQYKDFDWTQPILRGHHSQRKHEKVYERRASVMNRTIELDKKAKRMREKAENLLVFANRNKGDAENARQAKRDLADQAIQKGSIVSDWCFGQGEVLKVNTKTYTIRFTSGYKTTRDKSFIKT